MSTINEVAVVILNYKSWRDTLNEIDLCHKEIGIDYENIIVVDNASPNESKEELEKNSQLGYRFIYSTENNGYASGNNIGLKYAFNHGYKYALILNNDILFNDKEFLKKLLEVVDKDNKLAVVNPDVYSPSGYLFNRDAKRPNLFDYTVGMYLYKKRGRNIQDIDKYGYVYRPQGCCMLVDLNKLNQVDYLDDSTFLYYEEVILAERLINKGFRCACCTNTSIIHNHSTTVKSSFELNEIIKIKNKSFSYYLKEYRHYSNLKIKMCCAFNFLKEKCLN
ncbi:MULTISPECIES: glycosyltransferase [unclassified Holdemanella]|uniref:glycosyltransferase n=1 Tax=unclassified Holdemanella TaxID=2633909 RepID=UPI001D0AC004|nr:MULTISPECIES: glycosyltransferase family 2 protein [unclassified Holdemanella]MCB8642190.1 glycosyltransferase family 2 protein [Holdemanella sp. DFI.5.55]MCG5650547.1 glycosyltransferase family 2 protein [Holdemanella sp. DFI.5.21]